MIIPNNTSLYLQNCLSDTMRNRFQQKFFPCGKLLASVVFSGISLTAFADSYTDAEIAYRNGQYSKAFHFFQLAAKEGNKDALYNLGHMYLRGEGTRQDFTEARTCFLQAAQKADPGAQYQLGNLYYYGRGIEKDCQTAYKWYTKAAGQRYTPAVCARHS